jgi:sugar/nucleoside kinase (ribokinase family)
MLPKKAQSGKVSTKYKKYAKRKLCEMNVLTLGGATQDIFVHYKDPESLVIKNKRETRSYLLLEKGAKIEIESLSYSTGGGATNTAISFKKLGFAVAPIIKTGAGKAGQYVQSQLEHYGIDTSHIIKDATVGTGLSYIIPSFEGDRTILAYRGANEKMTIDDIPLEALKNAQCLYITSLSGNSAKVLVPVADFAKKHNLRVAVNPGVSQLSVGCKTLAQALKHIDIFILNSQEAKTFLLNLANQLLPKQLEPNKPVIHIETLPQLIKSLVYIEDINFNLKDFCTEIMHRGPSIIAVTNGEEGVYVAHEKTIYFYPSLPAQVVDSVGAGDAFGSCFAASLFEGYSVEDAIIHGVINASSVIEYEDATSGLLSREEIIKRAQHIDRSLMKTFKL